MAHRQSGSYKEEPGVAVAVPGDHVSVTCSFSCHPRFVEFSVAAAGLVRWLLSCQWRLPPGCSASPALTALPLPHLAARADGKFPCAGCEAVQSPLARVLGLEGGFRVGFQKITAVWTREARSSGIRSSEHHRVSEWAGFTGAQDRCRPQLGRQSHAAGCCCTDYSLAG